MIGSEGRVGRIIVEYLARWHVPRIVVDRNDELVAIADAHIIDPADGEILRYKWEGRDAPVCAVIRNRVTGAVGVYAISVITGRPVLIQPLMTVHRNVKPVRASREWRATKRWQDR